MKFLVFIIGLFFYFQANAQSDERWVEQALFNLPDVTFEKISHPGDPYLKYLLKIRQPLDHQHPEQGTFYQQVLFTHRGFDKPTVMNINGYNLYKAPNEIVKILDANELNIEYRYFGASSPDSLIWKYLNYTQVAEDLHRVNRMFKTLYPGKWISTGISRGGQTAIIYRYFYPDDVDVSIPYVAPVIIGIEDKRIYEFLDTIGTEACRKSIYNFQVSLLKNEKEILNRLEWYAKGKEFKFNYIGSLGKAFEFAVLEYPFSFWQVTDLTCNRVPRYTSADSALQDLLDVVGFDLFSDTEIEDFAAHYYQSETEGGYYGYETAPFRKYLNYIGSGNASAIFAPKTETYKAYDSTFMNKVIKWLDEKGSNFIYIYGGRDTWSACRVNVSQKVNSRLYMIPGANHYTARIRNMPPEMQGDFTSSLKKMAGIDADLKAIK